MEYNSYYPAQSGPPPLSGPPTMMNHQHDCSPMGGHMMPVGGPPPNMMHSNQPPSNMRQTPGSISMQQPPQHQGLHMQTMPPQQQPSPHPNYHQLPHTPLSHSASPHPSTTPLQQPSRPSTGPSPMHQQSPIHMNGPSPKVHPMMSASQQHMNHLPMGGPQPSGPQLLPPNVNQQPQPSLPPPPPQMHPPHNQNFINEPPMPPNPNSHYNQQPMNQHHGPPSQMHHGPPPPLPPHNHQAGPPPPPPSYMSHMHPAAVERGSPFYQHIPQTEFRIIELNKRLQNRPKPMDRVSPLPNFSDESSWWEKFACDFFDDDSTLTLRVPGEDKPTEYTIGRTLIPRFFRSYFEGGVNDLTIKLRNTRETAHHMNNFITLDCDQTDITTKNFFKHPATHMIMNVVVHTEGHLSLDFSNNFDNLLIKSWRFYTYQCHEYIDRSMTNTGLPHTYLVEPVTRYGLTKSTVAYLKMCMIMEPMQDLMLQHRQTKMDPRSCLKHLLYDKYKLKSVDDNRAQPKRRKRKTPAAGAGGTTKKSKANSANNSLAVGNNIGMNNNSTPTSDVGMSNLPLTSQDVLVVGEPSMLGADFGDENERRITRLENNQFDSSITNGNNSIGTTNKSQMNQPAQSEINNDIGQNPNQPQSSMLHTNNNNHETGRTGIPSILNHNNSGSGGGNSSNNNNISNNNSSASNNNNTSSMINSDHNMPNNINNCIQNSNNSGTNTSSSNNNGNNHQMNLMMNGTSTNNVNHIAKSEIELKQQSMSTGTPTFATESEAR